MSRIDPALYTVRPKFGPAGGPLEVVLTDEGEARAFSVGAQVRRGAAADALLALFSIGGEGFLSICNGSRHTVTAIGKFDQVAWGHLRALGYVESIPPVHGETGDGVRLTEQGKRAAQDGIEERSLVLARCRTAYLETSR